MSESTPVRTTKDLANCFDIQRTEEAKQDNFIEPIDELNPKQSIPTYQEWRDNLMVEEKNDAIESSPAVLIEMPYSKLSKTSQKSEKAGKTMTSAELVLRYSPTKIKNFAHMPLASSTSKGKQVSKPKDLEYSSHKPNSVSKFEVNGESNFKAKRDSLKGKQSSKPQTIQLETEVVGVEDLIKQVQDNKSEISSKKQRLRDLEEQIVSISDKMKTVFHKFGIDQMEQKVKELEDNYNAQKNDLFLPMMSIKSQNSNLDHIEEEKYNEIEDFNPPEQIEGGRNRDGSSKFQDIMEQEYASTEELMAMLRCGVDKKFKSFLDSCDKDIKLWKENARKEVEKFSNYLNSKQQTLRNNLANELSDFTPVFNGKF